MTWLLWRQHRLQLALAAGLIALFAVPVLVSGRKLADGYAACRSAGSCGPLLDGYASINTLVDLTVAVPAVLAVFWGASLLGRELETGTATLVWTQSVTRRHWLRTKIAVLLVSSALAGAAVSALVTWWSHPHNALVESRFAGVQFDIQGIVPVAYAVFGAALGLAAGAIWRRSLPAMATTLGGFFAVRLLVELGWRPHYRAPVVRIAGMSASGDVPAGAWVRSTDLTLHGRVVTGPVQVPGRCVPADSREKANQCLEAAGYRIRTTYQPAGRYWTFQWIEFSIFVALAAALVVTALVVLRRRDA